MSFDREVDRDVVYGPPSSHRRIVDMFTQATTHIDAAIKCVESAEPTLIELLPWARHFRDVINMALVHHRAIVLHGLISKLPETVRGMLYQPLTLVRKDIPPFTPLSKECLDNITLAIMSSITLAITLLQMMGINRYSIGIIRLGSLLSRAKSKDGMYLDRETIVAMLLELKDNVAAAAAAITAMVG